MMCIIFRSSGVGKFSYLRGRYSESKPTRGAIPKCKRGQWYIWVIYPIHIYRCLECDAFRGIESGAPQSVTQH
jgi:hypothetical protein